MNFMCKIELFCTKDTHVTTSFPCSSNMSDILVSKQLNMILIVFIGYWHKVLIMNWITQNVQKLFFGGKNKIKSNRNRQSFCFTTLSPFPFQTPFRSQSQSQSQSLIESSSKMNRLHIPPILLILIFTFSLLSGMLLFSPLIPNNFFNFLMIFLLLFNGCSDRIDDV